MSLTERAKALKVHLEKCLEVVNQILELICLDSDEGSSGESDYASTEEIECYIPAAPPLMRSETYIDNPVELPSKVYRKIEIDRFDE